MTIAQIVALQARKHQVGRLSLERSRHQARGGEWIVCAGILVLDVYGAVGPFGERFPNRLCGACGTEAQGDHFSAVLFLQLKALFESVCIGLVDLVREILFVNPLARRGDPQLRIASRNLLDRNHDFHRIVGYSRVYSEYRLKIRQPLVPPNPKLFDSAYSICILRA